MDFKRLVSLAWLNLLHDKRRLAVSAAGVSFAVVLMAMELGFRFALLDSMVELIRRLDTDLVIISRAKDTLISRVPFNRRILDEAMTFDEVQEACPLYIEAGVSILRNPDFDEGAGTSRRTGRHATARRIRVLAFDPPDQVFLIPEVEKKASELEAPGTALYDTKSKSAYGRIEPGLRTDLARRPVRVIGTFRLGTDLVNDGNLIMSDQNFLRYFPDRRLRTPDLRSVEVGLLRLARGADPRAMRAALQERLGPRGVRVLTKDEFLAREREFWDVRTPIGTVFSIGAILGLVVGAVICYQILSSDIADHLSEYATLKAMGRPNSFLVGVVIAEALILALAGFVPGIVLAGVLYRILAGATGLLMNLSAPRAALVLGLTVLMCFLSALAAIRRLLSADPAGLF